VRTSASGRIRRWVRAGIGVIRAAVATAIDASTNMWAPPAAVGGVAAKVAAPVQAKVASGKEIVSNLQQQGTAQGERADSPTQTALGTNKVLAVRAVQLAMQTLLTTRRTHL
jgi:hypothetical protein